MLRNLLTCGVLAIVLTISPVASAEDRSADAIAAEFEVTRPPQVDPGRKGDVAYIQELRAQAMEAMDKRAALAKELWEKDPSHPKAMEMMQFRWNHLVQTQRVGEAEGEITEAMEKAPAERKADIAFAKARVSMLDYTAEPASYVEAADDFIKAYPGDGRGGDLLAFAAQRSRDDEVATQLYRRIIAEFPTSKGVATAKAKLRLADGVGKPFELSFKEALTGKDISMNDLKGKVVVIDFWATWCGPCIAEMPHMKEIYAKYKDKGVEFIGISLDAPQSEGGLEKLKAYVTENDIQWPQYYQGKGWQSEFSSSWGINSIPALFIVDQKGNLYSSNARGKVEELIEKLLGDGKVGG
jgi:thiol-disulfide isomerase/thioredoxin